MSDNKSYGGFSVISTVKDGSYAQYAAEFRAALATGKYDVEKSYLSDNGAYVLYENGHKFHKDEIEAAKAMADSGIIVKLGNESDTAKATSRTQKGNPKFSEGTILIDKISYEQSSPSGESKSASHAVHKSLEHAKKKGSSVAVIYDKKGLMHETDVKNGILAYESHRTNTKRFKAILVIDKNGGVHEWTHTKK